MRPRTDQDDERLNSYFGQKCYLSSPFSPSRLKTIKSLTNPIGTRRSQLMRGRQKHPTRAIQIYT